MPVIRVLSVRQIASIVKPGRHAVGGGLYIVITPHSRQWWARSTDGTGRRVWRVLGNAQHISLTEARLLASAPPPKAQKAAALLPTFSQAAEAYISEHCPGWKHRAHLAQWRRSIALAERLGSLQVNAITPADVSAVLAPLADRPETLLRTRARIEMVLDAALLGAGLHGHVNPATMRLQQRLTSGLSPDRRRKARRAVEHHPALGMDATRALLAGLPRSTPARALAFTIFTALRTSETRLARWRHLDSATATLVLPPELTKTGITLTVPLSAAVMELIGLPGAPDAFIFLGRKRGAPISQDAMRMVLRRRTEGHATVHGFRATFRDWCRLTGKDAELAELSLGHVVGSAAARAYARNDALERRRTLMEEWAAALLGNV